MSLESIRQSLNKNPFIAGGALVLIIIIGLFFAIKSIIGPSGPPIPKYAYYIDEETGEESEQSINEIPPLVNEKTGKPTLVRASYYSCGSCKKGERKLAYLEKFTPQAKDTLEKARKASAEGQPPMEDMSVHMRGYLVRSPEPGAKWVLAESDPGRQVTSAIQCPGGDNTNLKLCLPDN